MNYILDRLDFEEQIVRTIPKVENTSEHEDDQQYSQSDQSNMNSNLIRTTLGMVMVTLPVALTQKPETRAKPNVQEVNVER